MFTREWALDPAGLEDEKVAISKNAFCNLVKILGEDFEDTTGCHREDMDDDCSMAKLYDEIREEFPQFFDENDGTFREEEY